MLHWPTRALKLLHVTALQMLWTWGQNTSWTAPEIHRNYQTDCNSHRKFHWDSFHWETTVKLVRDWLSLISFINFERDYLLIPSPSRGRSRNHSPERWSVKPSRGRNKNYAEGTLTQLETCIQRFLRKSSELQWELDFFRFNSSPTNSLFTHQLETID